MDRLEVFQWMTIQSGAREDGMYQRRPRATRMRHQNVVTVGGCVDRRGSRGKIAALPDPARAEDLEKERGMNG